jgi:hypothetical protein
MYIQKSKGLESPSIESRDSFKKGNYTLQGLSDRYDTDLVSNRAPSKNFEVHAIFSLFDQVSTGVVSLFKFFKTGYKDELHHFTLNRPAKYIANIVRDVNFRTGSFPKIALTLRENLWLTSVN